MNPTLQHKMIINVGVMIILLITACNSSVTNEFTEIQSEVVITLTQVPTETSTPVPTSTNTPQRTISASKTPSNTPIPTDIPTVEPTATPTITPVPPITNRQPSIAEIETYLTELFLMEEPSGHVIQLIYEDVNGDGEDDLVVSDYLFVGIFIWEETEYTGSFIYQGYPWKYDPGSRVALEDWTNDGISEVVFDFREDTGGTGVRITDWSRYVIHCQIDGISCKVVWAGQLGSLYEGYGPGGVSLLQTDVNQVNNDDNPPSLEVVTESFALYSQGAIPYSFPIEDGILSYSGGRKIEGSPPFYPIESLKVYTSTLDLFTWNGNEFEWQETQVLKPAEYIDSQATLESTNNQGQTASISVKPNNDAGLENDICQLSIDGNITGLPFGCKDNFTAVDWQDVTGDDESELVITAYSGVYLDAGFEGEYLVPDKDCIHQRMLIFQQENNQWKQIANVTGCIVQSNLYGVRLEDMNDDGQVEILAANGWFTAPRCYSVFSVSAPDGQQDNCWYEVGYQNEVYKWNGTEFVYWGIEE